ncbi:MAG: PEP-CTERM sorting domain-containing protein [Pseudomonadota bacterium]
MRRFLLSIVSSALLFAAGTTNAALFVFEDLNASNGGPIGNKLDTVSSSYNDSSDVFTWAATFSMNDVVDSFWLVVNNGPNPKSSNVNELAIMYGDVDNGIVTTYAYNGANSDNSWSNPGIYLGSSKLNSTANSVSFSLDATDINAWNSPGQTAPGYKGIQFDEKIGIWFHIARDSQFLYDLDGLITSYTRGAQGWYDKANLTATRVPAPGVWLLLALGLGAVALRKKLT